MTNHARPAIRRLPLPAGDADGCEPRSGMRRRYLQFSLGVAVAALPLTTVRGADWPTRPIRMIVPYPPGGANDITARVYSQHLGQLLGQPVVIENRAGAGGEIGAAMAATSEPDGHVALFGAIGSLTIHAAVPALKPSYDLMTAFQGVSMGSAVPLVIAVRSSLPARSVDDLLNLARTSPQRLSYGSAGNGSTQHMTGEYFQQTTGIELNHIPYRGSAQAISDLMGEQIDIVFETIPALSAQLPSGRVRVLGVTSAERSALLPDVPTIRETGFPTFEVSTYYGILVPRATPSGVVSRLSTSMQRLASRPEIQDALKQQGAVALATSPERTEELIRTELAKWRRVQEVAQIK